MRGVCARAGLIDRYFYESFEDRDALLVAVWDGILADVTTVLAGILAEGGDRSLIRLLGDAVSAVVYGPASDPRRAPILFGMHSGSTPLEERRHAMVGTVTDLMFVGIEARVDSRIDRHRLRLSMLMGVGGFLELVAQWRAGDIAVDASEIVDQAVHFGGVLATHYVPDVPATELAMPPGPLGDG